MWVMDDWLSGGVIQTGRETGVLRCCRSLMTYWRHYVTVSMTQLYVIVTSLMLMMMSRWNHLHRHLSSQSTTTPVYTRPVAINSACQLAMHVERDSVLANPSVRLSVCPSRAGTVSKRVDMSSKFFWHSNRGIILVFWALPPLQYSSRNPVSVGVKYTGVALKICNFPHLSWKRYELGPWLLWSELRSYYLT